MYGLFCVHCKNVLISTDILWQVFHILYYNRTGITNVRTVDPRFVVPPIYGYEPFTEPVPLKYGKLATKYPRRIDGHFCSVRAVKFRVIVLYYTLVANSGSWHTGCGRWRQRYDVSGQRDVTGCVCYNGGRHDGSDDVRYCSSQTADGSAVMIIFIRHEW